MRVGREFGTEFEVYISDAPSTFVSYVCDVIEDFSHVS